MAKARTIKFLKREAQDAFLSPDPRTVAIPTARAVLGAGKGNKPTGNWAHVAACCGVAAPQELFTLGDGWGGDHHGGAIGKAGDSWKGEDLGRRAVEAEVDTGLCGGGREFLGYKHAYLVGDLLVLRHGASSYSRKIAARTISAYLALDYLLTVPATQQVIEIGGRATGGKNAYSAILQRLWAGEKDVRVPRSDAAIACKMFEALTTSEREMLPTFPSGVEDAVAILERAKVVCPARFEWSWSEANDLIGSQDNWIARVRRDRGWFIDKRTGDRALVASSWSDELDAKGRPIYGRHDAWWLHGEPAWLLALTEEGLQVHRRPGGEGDEPAPDRDPDPPPADPLDTGDALAKALVEWGDEHGFQPARKLGREVRRAIRDERKRLREEESHEEQ